ncbi:unnamed protein product, partial [Didymodactylos carnosus]
STDTAHIHHGGDAKQKSLFFNDNFLSHVNKNEQQQQYPVNNYQLKNYHSRHEILPSEHDDIYKRSVSPRLRKRASDSSEYFSWANKNDRPLEYLRGKRGNKFWSFIKKDLSHNDHSLFHNSLTNGFWRSGIVGR